MKKFRVLPLLLILCLSFCCLAPAAGAVNDPDVSANAVVLADLESGSILYSRNMNEKAAPASLTKIMTVLLAIEAIEAGETTADTLVTAQSDCQQGLGDDSSTVNITPGEQMTLEDLMYCAMVHSANEACNVIASHVAGSIGGFVERMNERAAELGCTGTHFANTNGLTADSHYTTAYDMYLIAAEAVKHPLFMTICNTESYTVAATNYAAERILYNSNALISADSIYGSNYTYEYAVGVKTGFTRAAGNCLVSTAQKDGLNLIAVVMGCNGPNNSETEDYMNFVDSRTLYDWAFDSFEYRTVVTTSQVAAQAEVTLAAGDGTVTLHPAREMTLLVPNDLTEDDVRLNVTLYEEKLKAPIAAGTTLGEAEVLVNGSSCGTVKLVNTTAVELSRSEYFRIQIAGVFQNTFVRVVLIILFLFAAAYIALVVRYRRLRRKHLKQKREAEKRRRAMQAEVERRRRERSEAAARAGTPVTSDLYDNATRKYTKVDPSERNDHSVDVGDILDREVEDR